MGHSSRAGRPLMIPMMLVCSVMTCLLSSLSSAGPVKDPMEGNSLTKDDANLSWLSSPLISRSRALMETPLYLWLRANAGQADPLAVDNKIGMRNARADSMSDGSFLRFGRAGVNLPANWPLDGPPGGGHLIPDRYVRNTDFLRFG